MECIFNVQKNEHLKKYASTSHYITCIRLSSINVDNGVIIEKYKTITCND